VQICEFILTPQNFLNKVKVPEN